MCERIGPNITNERETNNNRPFQNYNPPQLRAKTPTSEFRNKAGLQQVKQRLSRITR
jgi:hypothetical protein